MKKYKKALERVGEAMLIAGLVDVIKMPNTTLGSVLVLIMGVAIVIVAERRK